MPNPRYRFRWVIRNKDEKYLTEEGNWDTNISNAAVFVATRASVIARMQKIDGLVTAFEVVKDKETNQIVFAMNGQTARLL